MLIERVYFDNTNIAEVSGNVYTLHKLAINKKYILNIDVSDVDIEKYDYYLKADVKSVTLIPNTIDTIKNDLKTSNTFKIEIKTSDETLEMTVFLLFCEKLKGASVNEYEKKFTIRYKVGTTESEQVNEKIENTNINNKSTNNAIQKGINTTRKILNRIRNTRMLFSSVKEAKNSPYYTIPVILLVPITFNDTITRSIKLTDHPVDNKSVVSDHAILMPVDYTLNGGMFGFDPISLLSHYTGDTAGIVGGAMEQVSLGIKAYLMERFFKARHLLTVVTPKGVLKDMMITKIIVSTNKDTSNVLDFTLTLREVQKAKVDIGSTVVNATEDGVEGAKDATTQTGVSTRQIHTSVAKTIGGKK